MRWAVLVIAMTACGTDDTPAPASDPFGALPVADTRAPMPRGRTVAWLGANGSYQVARTADGPRDAAVDVDVATKLVLGAASARGGAAAREAADWGRARLDRRTPVLGQLPTATALEGLSPISPIIVAWPNASAAAIADLAWRVGAAIAVATPDGAAGVLPWSFIASTAPGETTEPGWIELVGDASGLTLVDPAGGMEAVASDPIALEAAIARRAPKRIDVIAGEGMTAQQLVDVVGALAARHRIGIGATTGDATARSVAIAQTLRTRRVRIGQPNAMGDLDKAEIRKVVKAAHAALIDCDTIARARRPALRGTVSAQFVISAEGTVQNAGGSGVDPNLAGCVAGVIRGLHFPKPKGGGVVQVNYPFTFTPDD